MKKSIFFVALVAAALTFISCGSLKGHTSFYPKNDLEMEGLQGKVKEFHSKTYYAKNVDGEIVKTSIEDSSFMCFNAKGMKEKVISYYTELYSYSGDTCFVEAKMNDTNNEGPTFSILPYDQQIVIKDKKGNFLTEIRLHSGKELMRIEYINNSRGLPIEMKNYTDGVLTSITKVTENNHNGFPTKFEEYNLVGNIVRIMMIDGEDIKHMHSTKTEKMNDDGKLEPEMLQIYNDKGHVVKESWNFDILPYDMITEYTYKYDKEGNYIEKIASHSGHYTIEERTIIYY